MQLILSLIVLIYLAQKHQNVWWLKFLNLHWVCANLETKAGQSFKQVIEDHEDEYFVDLLFSCGTLYALVNGNDIDRDGVVVARSLNFGDHVVELKLVFNNEVWLEVFLGV